MYAHMEPDFELSSKGLMKIPISAGTKLPGAEELFDQPILAVKNPRLMRWWFKNTQMGPKEPDFELSSKGLLKIPISAGTKLPGAEELFDQPILAVKNPRLMRWWFKNTQMGPKVSFIKELKRRGETIKFTLPLDGDGKVYRDVTKGSLHGCIVTSKQSTRQNNLSSSCMEFIPTSSPTYRTVTSKTYLSFTVIMYMMTGL